MPETEAGGIDVSVVAACLNEVENVVPLAAALKAALTEANVTYEIIFIDNGSTDGTIDLVKDMCAKDETIRLIVNSRNFGYMRSPAHAIYQASGRAVVGMCSDFQDPPALLGEFIRRWRGGARIVLGVRASERQSTLMRVIRAVGYGFFERFGDYPVIPGATGFGLYDRVVVDCLKRWRDPEPFFRGMLVETGHRLETVPYSRPPRAAGESKNKFRNMLNFSLITLASSGKRLLRAPIFVSLFGFVIVFVTLVGAVIGWFAGYSPLGPLLAALVEFCFTLMFLFLGLIGEQVRVISEMVRDAPLVIERERVNFPSNT